MIYTDLIDALSLRPYAQALNQRAKQLKRPGQITAHQLYARLSQARGCCEWCGASLMNAPFEMDHVIALTKDGDHSIENLAVACEACNRQKADKHPAKFASEIYAKTRQLTPLIQRVLDHFGLTIQTQHRLFDTAAPNIQRFGDDEDIPPYHWT